MRFKEFYIFKEGYIEDEDRFGDWEEYVEKTPPLKAGVEILDKLKKAKPDSKNYIVGGAVRDIILGKDFDDVDIATNVPMETVDRLFPSHDIGRNKEFGIVVVEYKGYNFEISNFRSDGTYTDGRHPDKVTIVPDFKDDAARRDFTINAMAIDRDGNILDYFDGKKDIKDKVLRTVGNPEERFTEDYIRMLRAIRFASRMGFNVEPETFKAIQSQSDKIKGQAAERIMKEVLKMAKEPGTKFADAILMMKDVGLLQYILPEIDVMEGFQHTPAHHPEGNVIQHTIAALRTYKGNDPTVNMAILLHDVGKPETYKFDTEKGTHTYHGHEGESKRILEKIADRLKLQNKMKDALIFAASNHMNYFNIPKMSNSTIAQLLKSPYFDVLQQVALADTKARGSLYDQKEWNEIQEKINKIKEWSKGKDAVDAVRKVINGKLIMRIRPDIKPGPKMGDIIKDVTDYVMDNEIPLDDMETIEQLVKDWKES